MPWNPRHPRARPGDLAQLLGPRKKIFFIRLKPGADLHTNFGVIRHDDLIDHLWGSQVFSHAGTRFLLLQPRFGDLLLKTRRTTQILFPKDIGFLIINLGIGPGWRVLEAGTGSGALTTALAYAVGPQGRIFSYEIRPEMQALAQENLARLNLAERVTFRLQDAAEGFVDTDVDAAILDLPQPENYIPQTHIALKPGGFLGCILPTANQVSRLIEALRDNLFDGIEVCEILLRYYKPVPQRLRPTDRMVAHTGYLLFARAIQPPAEPPPSDELAI